MNEEKIPAFWVKNLGGPVRQDDSRGRTIVLTRGAVTPIYDGSLVERYQRAPQYYEVILPEAVVGVGDDPGVPSKDAKVRTTAAEAEDVLGPEALTFVEVVSMEGGAGEARLKLADGRVVALRQLLERMRKAGLVKLGKNERVTLFPGTDEVRVFKGLGDLLRGIQEAEGLLLPPPDAAGEGKG